MDEILKFILDEAEKYVKSTPGKLDDVLFFVVKRFLQHQGYVDHLKAAAEAQKLCVVVGEPPKTAA